MIIDGWPPVAAGAGDGFQRAVQGVEAPAGPKRRYATNACGVRPALTRLVEPSLVFVQAFPIG